MRDNEGRDIYLGIRLGMRLGKPGMRLEYMPCGGKGNAPSLWVMGSWSR